ncbi:MAG TPA: hypothetical protein VII97_02540 [Anaerolineales bacterium]
MKPALAFPYHDPDSTYFPHLQAILPDLKGHFERAYVCPPLSTRHQVGIMNWLEADRFFTVLPLEKPMQVGEHFAYLYQNAAQAAPPEQALHLCYVDRLSFALETQFREQFLADVDLLTDSDLPLIFQRSPKAWATHPENYSRLEGFVTQVGENLFGRRLDYGWCHLVIHAGELRAIMSKVTHPGLSMVAEIILHLQHHVHTREVDWLAWEDPFILDRDPGELKREREGSLAETEKRLSYVLPMVDALTKFSIK